jgi:hypothetical protein
VGVNDTEQVIRGMMSREKGRMGYRSMISNFIKRELEYSKGFNHGNIVLQIFKNIVISPI